MKYKLIDLLAMRSKCEVIPRKIRSVQYSEDVYCWDVNKQDYKHIEDGNCLFSSSDEYGAKSAYGVWSIEALNSEWEVINEKDQAKTI